MASLFLRTFPTVALAATLAFAPPQLRAQTPLNAAAVLPLPEALRTGASIAEYAPDGQSKVVRKGSNEMVCSATKMVDGNFHADCYQDLIFAATLRRAALAKELGKGGKPADPATLNASFAGEIKSGKIKLPDHPTTGFRMFGPASAYNAATNTVSSEIKSWQMIIIPFATGASLSLPEKATPGMPWVMSSGTWIAHVMVELTH